MSAHLILQLFISALFSAALTDFFFIYFSSVVLSTGVFCGVSVLCASSRATWAFARDRALPFHHTLSRIATCFSSPVPLNAILLTTVVQLLLGLIYLGSSTAFNAFVGVAVVCLGASNAMPVVISLCNGRKDIKGARFSLGKWGFVLNSVAVIWVLFATVLFSMPAVVPVTKTSMSASYSLLFPCVRFDPERYSDYASVVFVGFGVISGVWYVISTFYESFLG